MFPSSGLYRLPGVDDRRAPTATSVLSLNNKWVPSTFNMAIWNLQTSRYFDYWRWFGGDMLRETRTGSTKEAILLKYPLEINPIRDFSRKHAAILLGEESFDSSEPLVRTRVTPRPDLLSPELDVDGRDSSIEKKDRRLAQIAQDAINMVWSDSKGRSLQQENATLSQYLGGSVFEVKWNDKLTDRPIPIEIKNVMPDFFLPVFQADDYWNLLEAFVVYRISGNVARELYGITSINDTGWITYCEHWTRDEYSVWVDGKSITGKPRDDGTYAEPKNPFGFVPFVYIPHLREGNFYGSSMVEDLRGLAREFNARMADTGDAVRNSVHRRRYATDLRANPVPKQLDPNTWATYLGVTDPNSKASPKVWAEEPPVLPDSMANWPDKVWTQMLRAGSMSPMNYGEDEGSQRSALTLAFRMWPSTAHARAERVFWTDGLNQIARYILKILAVKRKFVDHIVSIPDDFAQRLQFSQDYLPMIPRDREQMVNEVVIRFQSGLLTPERALTMLGDTPYVMEEVKKIEEWMRLKVQIENSVGTKVQTTGGKSADGKNQGAQTQITMPIATDGTKE